MSVTRKLWLMLLPELGQFVARDQVQALKKAHKTELDIPELLGVAVGVALVTAVTRYAVPDQSLSSRFSLALLNFIVAVPLIALVVVPIHIRRLRRGLREQLNPREEKI
jgi:hypothetical protein